MICRIILWISLLANFALYFGWIDVWQYKWYVDQWVKFWKEMTDEQKRKEFMEKDWFNVAKDSLMKKYNQDIDKLKTELSNKSEQQVKDYLKQKFPNLSDKEIELISWYIKWSLNNSSVSSISSNK